MTTEEIKLSKTLENGIGFSCQMCGACCRGFNEGEVYLYMEDILRLAQHLNLKGKSGLKKFAERYLKTTDDTFFWIEPKAEEGKTYEFKTLGFKFTGDDEKCSFLVSNECTVHSYRPFQCRCFPFWQMLVSSRRNYVDYSKKCPGLRESLVNKGEYYSAEQILIWATEEYEIEKNYFLEMKKHDFDIYKVYPFLPKNFVEKENMIK